MGEEEEEEEDNLELSRVIANLHFGTGTDSAVADSSSDQQMNVNDNEEKNIMATPDIEIAWKLNFWLERIRGCGWKLGLEFPNLGEIPRDDDVVVDVDVDDDGDDDDAAHDFMCARYSSLFVGLLPFRPEDYEGDPLARLRREDRKMKRIVREEGVGGESVLKRRRRRRKRRRSEEERARAEGRERLERAAVVEDPDSRFLAMPRELRDVVYGFAVQEYDLKHRFGGTYRIVVKHNVIPALLRTCRQIAAEYGPIVRKSQTLALSDRFLPEVMIRSVKMSCEPFRWMRKMEVYLFAHCEACTNDEAVPHGCQVAREVEEHAMSLARMVRHMHLLESLEVRIDVAWPKTKEMWPNSPHHPSLKDSLEDLVQGRVTKVVVHRRREVLKKESRADEVAGRNDNLFAVWDKKEGWQGAEEKVLESDRKERRSDSVIDTDADDEA